MGRIIIVHLMFYKSIVTGHVMCLFSIFLRYQSKKILYHKNNIFPVEIPSDLKIFTRNRESCTCHDFNSYLFSSLKAEQSWLFPLIFMDEQLQVKVSASYCYCRIIIVVPCEWWWTNAQFSISFRTDIFILKSNI